MANLPELRTKEQIIGDLIDGFISRVNIGNADLNKGSILTQLLEAVGQQNFKASAEIIAMIDALSVDRAVGEALQRQARDKNVPILPATFSTGKVSITDVSFEKISSIVYSGQPAPVAGSLVVYVVDASNFPATGNIYIGRGTSNIEGPLSYTGIVPQGSGSYWKIILSPTSPTTKFHNISETVTLAQGGDRQIEAGTTVQTAQGIGVTSVKFSTEAKAIILDGEVTVNNVPVKCQQVGTLGNIAKGAIKEIIGLPFEATVTNDQPISDARNADNDEDIRARIKAYEQAKAKGTEAAIKLAALNVIAPDELKKVLSSSIARYADSSAALIFDDGTGYEPLFDGAGYEIIIDSAIGGEKELQLRRKPVAQARIKSNLSGPYNITDGSKLTVSVGGTEITHTFYSADFKVPGSATPFEVMASINSNSKNHFLASTANGTTRIVLYPKDKNYNEISVKSAPTGSVDANLVLGFSDAQESSLRLYKNNKPLYQDGITAKVDAKLKSLWPSSIIAGDTLSYKVDNTPEITVTFQNSSFQAHEITATVSYLTSIDLWVKVFNDLMPGVTAKVNGETISFFSNRGADDSARIEITGGTLKNKIFALDTALDSQGRSPDFTLNKQTGQLALAEVLQIGDRLTAGSQFTRANITTSDMPNGTGSTGTAWVIVDGDVDTIATEIQPASQIKFDKVGTELTITAQSPLAIPEGFGLAAPGDWILVWSKPTDPSDLITCSGFWRIKSVQTGQIIVDDTAIAPLTGSFISIDQNRIVIARSQAPLQKLDIPAATLNTLVDSIKAQLVGVNAEIVGAAIRLSTKTFANNGQLYIMAASGSGATMDLPVGEVVSNVPSHYGFTAISDSEVNVPSFRTGTLTSTVSDVEVIDTSLRGDLTGQFLEVLDKYDTVNVKTVPDSNADRRAFIAKYDSSLQKMTLLTPEYMKAGKSVIQAGDRYHTRESYRFDSTDTVGIIADGDAITKAYSLPVSRRLAVNAWSTPTFNSFSADDLESSLALADPSSFYNFNFADFKVWRQAQRTLTDGSYSIKFKANDFGPNGNRQRIGFTYPESSSQVTLGHRMGKSELIDIEIILPVKTIRTPSWDYTTAFTVAAATVGGKEIITFTAVAGTMPDFSIALSDVHVGDIVMISSSAGLLAGNKGFKARVTGVSANTFTVEKPLGAAVTDNLVGSNIVNQSGFITITTTTPHQFTSGQSVGLWNTSSPDGFAYPFNATYPVTVLSPTQIKVQTPNTVPGGLISSSQLVNKIAKMTTVQPHGLSVGNIVLVSGVGAAFDGMYPVRTVLNPNEFEYIRNQPDTIGFGGRFDYQSIAPQGIVAIGIITKILDTVTVDTVAAHGLSAGDIVDVSGVTINSWVNVSTYDVGDVVEYSGFLYKSTVALNIGNQPDLSPSQWEVTSEDLSGRFVVDTAPTATQFTYTYDDAVGITAGLSGVVAKMTPQVGLARCLGGQSNEYLEFLEVGADPSDIVTYVNDNMKGIVSATSTGANTTVSASTEDLGIATNYLSGTVTFVKTTAAQRSTRFTVNQLVPSGSEITVAGLVGAMAGYNGTYVVRSQTQTSPTTWDVEVQSGVIPSFGANNAVAGTFIGSTPAQRFFDGENLIDTCNLQSLVTNAQFQTKTAWFSVPDQQEELRLIACTSDHLVRFWNKYVVTGFSSVGSIENSQYGRQIQLSTQKFGGSGSVHVTGGLGNAMSTMIVGAGANNDRLGSFEIPYTTRKGLVLGQTINVKNQIRQAKRLGFSTTTALTVYDGAPQVAGIEIVGGTGTFQTVRPTTQAANTQVRVEKHGDFMAFIVVAGPDFGLNNVGVVEGDWVRIKNVTEAAWNSVSTYAIGNRVNYQGLNYTSLANGNTGNTPDSSPSQWRNEEFSSANQGVYQVVRVFGTDKFWVKSDSISEEQIILGNPASIAFYSYDSVMPGDKLRISSNVLGNTNAGTYIVLDEAAGPGFYFPTATRIWTTPIATDIASVTLGGDFDKVIIEEKDPISLWKKIVAVGPVNSSLVSVLVDSPELMDRIGSSASAYITAMGKLNFSTATNFGVDAYKYYKGLIAQLNKVIYGDTSNSIAYPGIRAAGTDIDIKPAIIKRIKIGLSVRIRTGIPFNEVRDRIKGSVAGYINRLGSGEQVSLSKVVAAAGSVPGVVSVAITSPAYDAINDQIAISADEKAFVVDPTADISVSVIGA